MLQTDRLLLSESDASNPLDERDGPPRVALSEADLERNEVVGPQTGSHQLSKVFGSEANMSLPGVSLLLAVLNDLISKQRYYKVRVSISVPLFYNPDENGYRAPVEPAKLEQTESEIRKHFNGYSHFPIEGWYRDDETGKEFWDQLERYEIDFAVNRPAVEFFESWKETLCERFRQRAFYVTLENTILHL